MNNIQIFKLCGVSQRNIDIFSLRSQGLTFQAIADKFNISRQAVHQICSRLSKLSSDNVLFLKSKINNSSISYYDISKLSIKERTFNALVKANISSLPSFEFLLFNAQKFSVIKGIGCRGIIDILQAVYSYEQTL